MVSAIVLINVERGNASQVSTALAELDGVAEVFSVAGRYDLVALIRAKDNEQLALLVSGEIAGKTEITYTETLIAFKAVSKKDMQSMFSVGMD